MNNSTSSLQQDERIEELFAKVNSALSFYCPLSYMLAGIVLNIFTAVVYLGKKFSKINMGFLCALLALVDALSLSVGFLVFFPPTVGFDLVTKADFLCKFFNFFRRYLIKLSSWLQLFVSVERTLFVCFPLRFHFFHQRKNINTMFGLMLIFLACIFMADVLYYQKPVTIVTGNRTIVVGFACQTSSTAAFVSDTISTIFRTFIPFGAMFACSYMMITSISRSAHKVKSNDTQREHQLARTITLLNIVFLITQLPLSFVQLTQNIFKYQENPSPLLLSTISMLNTVAFMLVYAYESAQFFLYMLFNKLFYHEVLKIVRQPRIFSSQLLVVVNSPEATNTH